MATQRDREILNAIVNPLLPVGEAVFDDADQIPVTLLDEEVDNTEEYKTSRKLELDAIQEAEKGNLAEALAVMSKAMALTPTRASCYNNRAQIHRFNSNISAALQDLNKAIQISHGRGRSACQAFCQRGMIYRLEGRDDLARCDFDSASQLGSKFAKSALAAMNPYAAMCNQMLKNVFTALEQGSETVDDPFKPIDKKSG